MATAIIGQKQSFKSTLMMCYAYELTGENSDLQILYVAPISRLEQNKFYFGKYKELDITRLEMIKNKYLNTFRELYLFLVYFYKLNQRFNMVIIDELDFYIQDKDVNQRTKKLNLILFLISTIHKFVKSTQNINPVYYCLISSVLQQSADNPENIISLINCLNYYGHKNIQVAEILVIKSLKISLKDGKYIISKEDIDKPILMAKIAFEITQSLQAAQTTKQKTM